MDCIKIAVGSVVSAIAALAAIVGVVLYKKNH